MVCVCVHAYRDASADAGWERFVWMLPQVVCTTHVLVTTCTTHALANPHTQIYTHAHENKQIHTYTHRFTPTYAQNTQMNAYTPPNYKHTCKSVLGPTKWPAMLSNAIVRGSSLL